MSIRRLRSVVFLAAAALGCSDSMPGPCLALPIAFQPAVLVGVSDSVTGLPKADSATGTLQLLFNPSDSLRHGWGQADSTLMGIGGAGTYIVTVTRPGYALWVRNNVVVSGTRCYGPVTVDLVARLQPAP